MKVSLIVTVLNEEKTIDSFLASVEAQTLKPDEVVVADGGSSDRTVERIKNFIHLTSINRTNSLLISSPSEESRSLPRHLGGVLSPFCKRELYRSRTEVRYYEKRGANRAEGRNLAIKKAKNEIIAVSDAGCILDKNWLEEIVKPFSDSIVDVVAGYYQAKTKTIFEKCVVPYVLVMPDKVDPNEFLPATRSMAIRKSVWKKTGGFPEEFSDNEDYVFANKLKKEKFKIFFCPKALVYWLPRSNLKSFGKMIYRFAKGDAQAGLRHKKVTTVFLRYLIFATLIFFYNNYKFYKPNLIFIIFLPFLYFVWAILKNYRYVRDIRALFWLPVLQVTADLAVMAGTVRGYEFRTFLGSHLGDSRTDSEA